jgi:hypothetical protein
VRQEQLQAHLAIFLAKNDVAGSDLLERPGI